MFIEAIQTCFIYVFGTLISFGGATPENLKIDEDLLEAGSIVSQLWGYVAILGIGMNIIYFLLELNQRLAFEGRDLNMKSVFAPFLKLMAAIAILYNSDKIIGWIIGFGNSAIDKVSGWVVDPIALNNGYFGSGGTIIEWETAFDPENATMLETVSTITIGSVLDEALGILTFGGSVLLLAFLLIFWLVSMILTVVWDYKAIAYKLEVLYRVAVTPVAMADVYSGQNSGAIRWIKGCIGLAIYGMAFIVIPKIAGNMVLTELLNAFTGIDSGSGVWNIIVKLAACIAVPLAALGCMSAVKQVTKEALG